MPELLHGGDGEGIEVGRGVAGRSLRASDYAGEEKSTFPSRPSGGRRGMSERESYWTPGVWNAFSSCPSLDVLRRLFIFKIQPLHNQSGRWKRHRFQKHWSRAISSLAAALLAGAPTVPRTRSQLCTSPAGNKHPQWAKGASR